MIVVGPQAASLREKWVQSVTHAGWQPAFRPRMLDLIRHIRDDIAPLDRRAVFAFVYAAVGLTCIAYLKDPIYVQAILAKTPWAYIGNEAANSTANNLYALIWWYLFR